jgi:hypothetical protein
MAQLVLFHERADVDAIVWIYINHAKSDGLPFPNDHRLSAHELARLTDRSKPVIAILDCCYSSELADEALGQLSANSPVAFLTTAESLTSAFVLSDDPDLVEQCGPVRYFVSSSLFARSLFQVVFYSDAAGPISNLPRLMNEGSKRLRGFHAKFHTAYPAMRDLDFRLLFGDPVPEYTLLYGGTRRFSEVIPRRPAGGFPDDLTQFANVKTSTRDDLQFAYVRVRRNPVDHTVEWYGHAILDELDPDQAAIRAQAKLARDGEARDEPSHVLVGDITDYIIGDLKNQGVSRWTGHIPTLLISTLINFVERLNGVTTAREQVDLAILASYVVDQDIQSVFELIENGRYAIAAEQEIPLDGRPSVPLSAKHLDMSQHIERLIGRVTQCMTYDCGDLKHVIVRDLHWSSVNLEEAGLQAILSGVLGVTNGRLDKVPVCLQIALCQLIADHRQNLASDSVIGQVFDIILRFPTPTSTDHSLNFELAEAALYALIRLSARFPRTGSQVTGVKWIEDGNRDAYDAVDMSARFDALMTRLAEIENQLPDFLSECDERLKIAGQLRIQNQRMRDEDEETPLEATAKEQRMGSNIRQLCACLRSTEPLRAVLPRWISWHARPCRLTGRDPLRDALRETRRSRRRAKDRRDPEASAPIDSDDSS